MTDSRGGTACPCVKNDVMIWKLPVRGTSNFETIMHLVSTYINLRVKKHTRKTRETRACVSCETFKRLT